jgi:hypothetical protein
MLQKIILKKNFLVFFAHDEALAVNKKLKIGQKKFIKISALSGQNFLGQT